MDLLLTILLIVIPAVISSQKKKKKAAEQARRQNAFDEAAEAYPAKPAVREKMNRVVKDLAKEASEATGKGKKEAVKIPFSKEEWASFLKEAAEEDKDIFPKKAAPAAEGRAAQAAAPAPAGPAAAPAFAAIEPRPIMRTPIQHREGEHPLVHAEHRKRIAEEEARLHRERTELEELRAVNLKKLRAAVVMSEILDKPVALRPHRRF